MAKNKLAWKIGGEAGAGISATGYAFALACARGGLHINTYSEYPSLIRGGHNTFQVRAEGSRIYSHIGPVDLLVALNKETIDYHKHEITENGGIIYDGDNIKIDRSELRQDIKLYNVPMLKLAQQAGGGKIMVNSVALGATVAIIDYSLELLENVITKEFSRKGTIILHEDIEAAKLGYTHIKKNYPNDFKAKLEKIGSARMLLTGNDAVCLGAIKAGCKFFAAYPMTPASSILHFMAAHEKDFSMVVKQSEDELAAINMAIGAGFAGVRSMTATSGGGFSLMTEALGLAGMAETPVVVVECQRPGPSTGLPTWTGQGDLRQVLHASQDDYPKIVIAPGDANECYYRTIEAFNLAEKYQLPVIILSDKLLAEGFVTEDKFNDVVIERNLIADSPEGYKRYKFTDSGTSPRAIPGQKNCIHVATSDEHDEYGSICEDETNRNMMMDKRMRKLDYALRELPEPELLGEKDADVTIISCGSTKGAVIEAMNYLANEGVKSNYLQITYLNPLHADKISKIIIDANKTVVIENNKTGQLAGLIKEKTSLAVDYKILKYSGRPFYAGEICEKIRGLK